MGLVKGEVKLEQYDLKWQAEFEAEKLELEKIFGEVALDIQHVGSTSVRGLSAKPIIDIAVAVHTLGEFDAVRPKIAELKDYSIKENPTPGEILIRKHNPENHDEITHFIHVMPESEDRYKDTILFRDTLRNNTKIRIEYEELKQDLARKYPHDRESYTASKDFFVRSVINEAKGKKPAKSKAEDFRIIGLLIGVLLATAVYLFVTIPTIIKRLTAEEGFKFRPFDMPETFWPNMLFLAPIILAVMASSFFLMRSAVKTGKTLIFWIAFLIFIITPILAILT